MNNKKRNDPQRIDKDFEKDMREIARERVFKGLAKPLPKEISIVAMTNLLRRTQGYKMSIFDLKTKPKKEDIKW